MTGTNSGTTKCLPSTPNQPQTVDDFGMESTGAWDEARGSAYIVMPAPPSAPETPVPEPIQRRRRWRRRCLWLALAGVVVWALFTTVRQHDEWWVQKRATSDSAGWWLVLRPLKFTQKLYFQRHGYYAASGATLHADGTLIAHDLAAAFADCDGNGDSPSPTPKAGYLVRMLQGQGVGDGLRYRVQADNPTAGLTQWAATCRAAEPGSSGESQYLLLADGHLYRHAEPPADDPQYNQFLLDAVPDLYLTDGTIDSAWLQREGWVACVWEDG